jgi:hypothetical protein
LAPALKTLQAGVVVVNSKVVGLAPGFLFTSLSRGEPATKRCFGEKMIFFLIRNRRSHIVVFPS